MSTRMSFHDTNLFRTFGMVKRRERENLPLSRRTFQRQIVRNGHPITMHIKVCGMIGWYQKNLDACCCEKEGKHFCIYHHCMCLGDSSLFTEQAGEKRNAQKKVKIDILCTCIHTYIHTPHRRQTRKNGYDNIQVENRYRSCCCCFETTRGRKAAAATTTTSCQKLSIIIYKHSRFVKRSKKEKKKSDRVIGENPYITRL